MNISSKNWSVISDGHGNATLRDRAAPYHPHLIKVSDLPTVNAMAMMKEVDFDRVMQKLAYSQTICKE